MAQSAGVTPDAVSASACARDCLLVQCGARADLLLDCLLTTSDQFCGTSLFVEREMTTANHLSRWVLCEALWSALQAELDSDCPLCSPFGRLSVLGIEQAGSPAEGLSDIYPDRVCSSAFNTMYELGPVRWLPSDRAGHELDARSGGGRPSDPPLLQARQSGDSPGFVRLWRAPTADCRHRDALEFPAEPVRRLMLQRQKLVTSSPETEVVLSGPAVVVREPGGNIRCEVYVPCLHMPLWPAGEFVTRCRYSDFPPAAARRDICSFGVHLVPTGRRGSRWQSREWRLSFSRAELVAAWHLSDVQLDAIKATETCKRLLEFPGKKHLKPRYIKTAVFWLCQDLPSYSWKSVTRGVRLILDYLDSSVVTGHLPCFFWAEINLLQSRTSAEKDAIRRTISLIRSNTTQLLMLYCCENDKVAVAPLLLDCPAAALSERRLRSCLARGLVTRAVIEALSYRPTAPCWRHWAAAVIPPLLRHSAAGQLEAEHHRMGPAHAQWYLLQALAVAPADLVAATRPGPPPIGGDVITLDAAPLFGLLTSWDLARLTATLPGLRAWLHRHEDEVLGRALADLLLAPSPSDDRPLDPVTAPERGEQFLEWRWERLWKKPDSYEDHRRTLGDLYGLGLTDIVLVVTLRLGLDEPRAVALARRWRTGLRDQLEGPERGASSLRARCEWARSVPWDRWRLRQYVFRDSQ